MSQKRHFTAALKFTTATDTTVLKAVKDSTYTIFVKKISITFTTSGADTVAFKDSAGSAFTIVTTDASPTVNTEYIWEFAGEGVALTEGKDLKAVFSATGTIAGHIQVEGHQRKTS